MKKIKLFLAALAAMVGLGAFAQEDITSTYLTNADLSSTDGWTITGEIGGTLNTEMDVNAIEFYHSWSANAGAAIGNSKSFRFSQTINLPAGDYRIAVNAFYREGNGNGTNTKAYIFAGETQKYIHAVTASEQSDLSNGNGKHKNAKVANDMGRAAYAFSIGDFEEAFDFSVEEAGEIEIGFNGYIDTYCSWCIFGPMKLYKYSLEDYLVDYDAKYAEAEALDGKPMNADVQSALTAAMVDRESFTLTSQVTAAIATLTTAINNATTSVNNYAALKAQIDKADLFDSYGTAAYEAVEGVSDAIDAYNNRTATDGASEIATLKAAFNAGVLATKQPGNGMDMTAYITNPDFNSGNYDGWTRVTPYGGNCTIQGGSRMEYWAGNASNRAEASFDIYQEIENLPAGVYTISADMYNSLNNEGGDYTVFSPTCGVYGSSSNEEVALVNEEGETLKTYTTDEVLYFRGKLRIGTKNTVTPMAARWFLFDNVKLTYARQLTDEEIAANTVPESISLDQTNVSMRTASTATLTATILPENANDKSVTWTSSDETVATVADGVVAALKAGTVTITAKANGADDVEATATITVADAAAPAYYSSEIVSGKDYYLMNAATGLYLGGANDWGTHASLIEHGVPFTATLISEGVYTLASPIWNNTTDHFVTGTYVDNTTTNLTITSVGNGKFTISNAEGLMSAQASNTKVELNGDANNTTAQWYFISKVDRDKMLAAATAENPVDATYYVKQANPSRNLSASNTKQGENAWSDYSLVGDDANKVGQLYQKAGDISQTITNIPNGTYTVTVQAFTSGSATFYANEEEVDVLPNSENIGAAATAANRFAAKAFTNTLTVTVTNRTLKIGLKTEDTDKWLVWDDVNLYMTGYTANTGLTASIDKDEFEAGQTATITAATNPATASFNAITYSSSAEEVATVDENGVVTGVGAGTATITVAATEMENFTKTIDVTVTATPPTALAMSEEEVALDTNTTTATLTVTPTPATGNTSVTWTSSDETVASVADGVVTAVSTGSATITATSTVDPTVSATATVTVTLPESDYALSSYTNDGATRSVITLGENLIKNGSFEYPNAVAGWKTIGYTTDAVASNFTINATGGVNDGAYITTNGAGTGSEKTLRKSFAVENGKTYYFSVYTSGKAPSSNNFQYNALFAMSDATTEASMLKEFEWPQGAGSTTTEWNKTEYIFTATTDYVGVRMGWNENSKFDNFVLAEVLSSTTEGNVDYATAAIPTANIGTGVFQYSQDAIDAANALVQGTATVAEVEAAYEAVTTLNAPAADKRYTLTIVEDGKDWNGNAITFMAGARSDQGGYGIKYFAPANKNLAQALKLTAVSGNKYKVSVVNADGNEQYLTTAKLGYNTGDNKQIRTTDDASKALEIEIQATATDGQFQLYNTAQSSVIANNGNNDVYTANSVNFTIAEAEEASIAINTTAAGWGTTILPFAVAELPTDVKAYTCAGVTPEDNTVLELSEVSALEANKPYIIEGAWNETLTGDAQGTALTYTEGLLTGVYEPTTATAGTYVLQNKDNRVAFYQVKEGAEPTVGANRAYLTAPSAEGVKAFFFPDMTTAIQGVFSEMANGNIYDLQGRKVQKMQKGGVYVINGQKVTVK